ncbi:DUF6436 domain-containing protein [Pseudomonas nitroreducens]|uniref:DUF6436 domain-containing protein n=1 Tax=Pseudomonas nitroreducens TaxID=46680 RepID=UPI00351D8E4E
MSTRRKTLIGWLIAALCLAGLLSTYAWYEKRYIRPFSQQPQLFSGDHLMLPAQLAGPGLIRLVHFWDPACPCNVGNQQHLAELIARFAPQGVDFYAVQKAGSHGQLPDTLKSMRPLPTLPGAEQLPATPAVAIWDAQGNLAYVGPYSEGAVCTSSNSFIEPILEALVQGRRVQATHTLAVGCYCPWTGTAKK